jgi:parvulin-like peptidyl-prolyl isomerase
MEIGDLEKPVEEYRDRTKLVWAGVLCVFVVMIGAMWFMQKPRAQVSSVRARHILITYNSADAADRMRALERVTDIRERLLKGEGFDKLAREYSEDPASSRKGGDLGWAPKGSFAKAFEEYCWTAPLGELSDIVQTEYGFHLIKVDDRHRTAAEEYEAELDRKAWELEKGKEGGAAEPPAAGAAQ